MARAFGLGTSDKGDEMEPWKQKGPTAVYVSASPYIPGKVEKIQALPVPAEEQDETPKTDVPMQKVVRPKAASGLRALTLLFGRRGPK